MSSPKKLCNIFAVFIAILFLFGCDTKQGRDSKIKETIQRSEELSSGYLHGNINEARRCLMDNARLLESATFLEPNGHARLLAVVYFRLYVLETRSGNESLANADLIKARYWSLRAGELQGMEIGITHFGTNQIFDYVNDLDKRHNNGKEPRYVK